MVILYLKEATRVFWPMACVCMVKAAYARSTLAYISPCMCMQGRRHNRIPFPICSVIPPLRLLL